jgi:potassium efflux system protein
MNNKGKLHLKSASALLAFIFVIAVPGISVSQQQDGPPEERLNSNAPAEAPGVISVEELKKFRAAAENAGDLAENVKKGVLSFLDRAIIFREREAQLRQDIEDVKQQAKTAPERIKAIGAELDRPLPPPENIATTASNMKPDQFEAQLRKVETNLADATTDLNRLTDQLNTLKNQPAQNQQGIADAKKRLLEIAGELAAAPSPDEPQAVMKTRRVALAAEQAKSETEIKALENRLTNYELLTALTTAQRDLAAREVTRQQALVKVWQAEVQRIRELEAKKDRVVAEEAKKQAAALPPVLQKQFDVNINLGKLLEKTTAEEAGIAEKLKLRQTQLKQIEEEFTQAREQVKYPMQTETIGLALREQRRALPSMEKYRRDSDQRQVQMGEIRAVQLDLDRQRRELADLDQAVVLTLQKENIPPDADIELLKTELRRLLSDRRELLKKLQDSYQRLFKNLQALEFIEQQIATKAEEEALFLDEHLFWIRSAKSIGMADLKNLPAAVNWFLKPTNWWQVVDNLMESLVRNPIMWGLGLLVSFTFIGLRSWAHRDLSRCARGVYSVKTDSFVLTLRALALTSRAAFGWPLLMIFGGWQLAKLPSIADFTLAISHGLIFAGQALAGGLFLFEFCWKDGVAKVHFKWPESVRRVIRRSLKWFVLLLVTSHFVMAVVQAKNEISYIDSLGRLAFIALMIGFSAWAAYFLRFSGEIVAMMMRRRREGWLVRMRFIWYTLAVGVPLVLAILSGMGYYYSAVALYMRLGATIALILGMIIVKDMLLRWLFITQRRLTFDELRRKKELRDEQPDKELPAGTGLEGEAVAIEEPEINLDQIYEKNRELLRTLIFFSSLIGFWLIWANVLPALNFLENVELWSYSSEVNGAAKMVPITLANLMVAVIVAIVTVVAAKNLPGLLEIILLNWFPMDAGSRNAVSTIFNYAITALGIVIAFTTIGIKWSNIQWLIAALGVGVGFGLQEIVANFICGLIVLFERPFRIGDTVTIGDVSGTVTRIRIRATTVMDWDRKELIVPNKEFITGRLVNWSLSDNIIRVRIPIGIAYGSDTALAENLMLKAAEANGLVLANPAPQAVFLGFGDNSLNFEMRVFINGINDWIPMLHKLNQTIDREFRQANVNISFPQRDVHLDQIGPLEVRVVMDPKNCTG